MNQTNSVTHEQCLLSLRGLVKHYDNKAVLAGIDLDIRDGEFLTLLGPSGCGKTTILRLIAGFETPDEGHLLLNGTEITRFPPHQRHINTVFQSYALFPHLNVRDNIAFGLHMKKIAKDEIRQRIDEALQIVQLQGLENRKPNQLSGGQQQRVALARALVNRPALLLLDESLSALDFKLRKQMQIELKTLQRKLGITFVFVTHDQEEALSMSDRVVVMRAGQIEQIGTPREVYEAPRNLFVANFVGESNFLNGKVLRLLDAERIEASVEQLVCELRVSHAFQPGDAIKLMLRPEDLRIQSPQNAHKLDYWFKGFIEERNYKGMTLDSVIRLASGQRLLASEFFDEDDPDFDYAIGEEVAVGWVRNWEHVMPDE